MSDEETLQPEAEQPRRPEDGTTQSLPRPGGQGSESARAGTPVPPLLPGAPGSDSAGTPSTIVRPPDGRVPAPSTPRPTIPGYEILEELGRGGMGVVYKARHIGLNRIVALKMILAAEHAGREAVARFRAEAEAVAQLKHPNIIQVYDIGEQDGRPYFSMEFVEGGSLAKHIAGQPQPPKWCAEICEKLSLAMHLAHSQGIVHRDLKPANVLLFVPLAPAGRGAGVRGKQGVAPSPGAKAPPSPHGGEGSDEPKIMDFGLAKRLEGGTTLTQSGAVMGTPQYMAPEQASGEAKRVGPPADVYALGAILYTMLTGHPPFSADTPLGVLRKVLGEEPTPPTTLHKRVPPDLETICLKCLQKEPAKRYASAHELAADLRRFLNHEPIVARASSPWEKAAMWSKRRPAAAALIGVSALALLALIGGGAWYNARLAASLKETRTERDQKDRERQKAEENLRKSQERLAESLISQADALCLAGRVRESLDRYNEARRTLTGLREPTLTADAGLFELRSAYPWALNTFGSQTEFVSSVAFSPDGKLALSGSGGNTLKLWDVATGRELRTFSGHAGSVTSVAFSPDGRLALLGGRVLELWDVGTGRGLGTFGGQTEFVESVAFSPDGKLALSGSQDNRLKLWDVATGRELRTFSGHTGDISSVAFSRDGKLALSASGGLDQTLKLWDVATGRELRTFSGHTGAVQSVAFSPDGNLALSACRQPFSLGQEMNNELKLWDVATGRELQTFSGGERSVAFSPDGKLALSGSHDHTLKLWDMRTTRGLRTFSGHTESLLGVAFSSDGKLALSGSWDKTLKLWDVATGGELRAFSGRTGEVHCVAFSPDGNLALSGSGDSTLKLWDVATGSELRTFSGHTDWVLSVAFSACGNLALSGSGDSKLRLWDVATGRKIRTFSGHTGIVYSVAFSPDGKLALSGSIDEKLKLWDVATGRELRTFNGHTDPVSCVAFSPDGNLALSGRMDMTMKLWDVATGRELRTFNGHTGEVHCVAFSPDGNLALQGSDLKTLKLWDVATGRELRTFSGHTDRVCSVAFSPDGKLALSGSKDEKLKLWDVATGRELRTFSGHTNRVFSVAFSPDGNLALSGSQDMTLQLRDFTRPARYGEFDILLPKAREAIQKNENDAEALRTFGEWYAFRGKNDWAVDFLEKARKNGANVPPLTLARCYWLLAEEVGRFAESPGRVGNSPHYRAAAAEFQKELTRLKAQPVPQEAKAKLARENEERYINLCLQAVTKPATEK